MKKHGIKVAIIIISVVVAVAMVISAILTVNYFAQKKKPLSYEQGVASSVSSTVSDSSSDKTNTESSKNDASSQKTSNPQSSSKVENSAPEIEDAKVVSPEKITKIFSFDNKFVVSAVKRQVFYDSKNGNSLPYCLYMPENYTPSKKYPVILFLHGAGEIGTDNQEQLKNINNLFKYNGDLISNAILLCPQTSQWWSLDREQSGDQKGHLGSALHLLQEIQKKYSCDSNRIYVTGLSMGGMATWDLLQEYGDIFAAGIPVCGAGNPYNVSMLRDKPIRIYHGTADATVSFSNSQQMYDAIVKSGGKKVKFFVLEGVGHNAWDTAYADRDTFSWLLAQNKMTNPSGEYEYVHYFKITDSKGNVVITEKDVSEVVFSNDFGENPTCTVDVILTDNGKNKLKKAYQNSNGKEFTVHWSTQKLCTFTATTPPVNNVFTMVNVLSEDNAKNFADMVNKFNE